jgi:succinate dehydrogenase / fumarate reductase iron-sulfur subunit
MKITIKRTSRRNDVHIENNDVVYEYQPQNPDEKTVALDVLLQAGDTELPDLAHRYGCRNGLCGACTADINGKPRLTCRTRVKDGDSIAPMASLPVVRDLVVQRDFINKQLQGKLPLVAPAENNSDHYSDAFHSLNRCIECYACLHNCKSHQQNPPQGPYQWGNPYSFLRIQKVMLDSAASESQKQQALSLARELGIDRYSLDKVPGCGVGINLKKEVIIPLQKMSEQL